MFPNRTQSAILFLNIRCGIAQPASLKGSCRPPRGEGKLFLSVPGVAGEITATETLFIMNGWRSLTLKCTLTYSKQGKKTHSKRTRFALKIASLELYSPLIVKVRAWYMFGVSQMFRFLGRPWLVLFVLAADCSALWRLCEQFLHCTGCSGQLAFISVTVDNREREREREEGGGGKVKLGKEKERQTVQEENQTRKKKGKERL